MLKRKSRAKDAGSDLRRVLGGMELPTIPGVVTMAIEQVSAPECDMRQVAETVSRDPGLSARILSVVNSAAYAPRNPIVGVSQAVTMFGKNQLESMLISLAASRATSQAAAPGFDLGAFWQVAAWKASAAGTLSRRFDRARSSENFSAALLQDIAIPLLVSGHPRYRSVLADWQNGGGDLIEMEKKAFGWTHYEVAGWLFDEWGFPEKLRVAVTESGEPQSATVEYPVVRAVSCLGAPLPEPEVVERGAVLLGAAFGLDPESARQLLETARVDGAKLAQSLA
jgi:HD-like signal output (HDOD) protein